MEDGPRTLLCASAIGYYGDRGEETLTEVSPPGDGFLASVHREAEQAADVADRAGLRVAHLRFGIVQSLEGGALAWLLPRFRRGLGIRAGAGGQYVSWVSLPDVVRAIDHVLDHAVARRPGQRRRAASGDQPRVRRHPRPRPRPAAVPGPDRGV